MTLNTIIVIIAIIETEFSVIRFNEVYAYLLWSITHVPSGAALCWRRSPTETSDRAVRETGRMLLGSTHAVPEHGMLEVEGEREAGWLETRTIGATLDGLAHRWR